jgi:hypothetical protein
MREKVTSGAPSVDAIHVPAIKIDPDQGESLPDPAPIFIVLK